MTGTVRPTDRTIAAVAIVRDGTVLVGRRVRPPAVRGGWEFPGGSVEPGETPQQAAVREAREELDVDVELTGTLGTVPIRRRMWLTVFTSVLTSGEPVVTGSHDQLRWVGVDDLAGLAWLAPDRPLLEPLRAVLLAAAPSTGAAASDGGPLGSAPPDRREPPTGRRD